MATLVEFLADTGNDVDMQPDMKGLTGFVTLTPSVKFVRLPYVDVPLTAAAGKIVCPVFAGKLYRPGTSEADALSSAVAPGVSVIASQQPNMSPDAFYWTASFNLTGMYPQPSSVDFELTAGQTIDLTNVAPTTPIAGVTYVVLTADYEEALAALADAQAINALYPEPVALTQAQYDALTPDPDTYYFIIP